MDVKRGLTRWKQQIRKVILEAAFWIWVRKTVFAKAREKYVVVIKAWDDDSLDERFRVWMDKEGHSLEMLYRINLQDLDRGPVNDDTQIMHPRDRQNGGVEKGNGRKRRD